MDNNLENEIVNQDTPNEVPVDQPAAPVEEVVNEPAAPVEPVAPANPTVEPVAPAPAAEAPAVKPKKKKTGLFIVLGVLVALIAAVAIYFTMFYNKTKPIEAVNKALNNLIVTKPNSGTLDLSLNLGVKDSISLNASATMKFEREKEDKYNIIFKINKNLLMDESSLYILTDKEMFNIYVQSTLVDLLGSTYSDEAIWLNQELDVSEFLTDDQYEELYEEETPDSIDLKEVLSDKDVVFVDKEDGLKHYRVTLNKKNMKKIAKELDVDEDEMDSLDEMKDFDIDVYIDSKDQISKISLDLAKAVDEESFDKFEIVLEYKDLNKTTVKVPSDVKKSAVSFAEYMGSNLIADYNEKNLFNIDDSSDF